MALGRHVESLGLDRQEEAADGADRHVEHRRLRGLQVLEEPRRPAADVGVEEVALLGKVRRCAEAAGDEAGHHLAERGDMRSEEHTSELQSLMRISYAVFCLKNKTN